MSSAAPNWESLTGKPFPHIAGGTQTLLGGAAEGLDALFVAEWLARGDASEIVWITADSRRQDALSRMMDFFAPDLLRHDVPAWDCLPYDRLSPDAETAAAIAASLSRMAERRLSAGEGDRARRPRLTIMPIQTALRRVPPPATMREGVLTIKRGQQISRGHILDHLKKWGYRRVDVVSLCGDYAVRGGLLDVWSSGDAPARLDMFGDRVESARHFDASTQRTVGEPDEIRLSPASEIALTAESGGLFRTEWRRRFGAEGARDAIFAAMSAPARVPGMEHYLPLFHDEMASVFSYIAEGAAIILDHGAEAAMERFLALAASCYEERQKYVKAPEEGEGEDGGDRGDIWRPLPLEDMWLTEAAWREALEGRTLLRLSPFVADEGEAGEGGAQTLDLGSRRALPNFSASRLRAGGLAEAIHHYAQTLRERDKDARLLIASANDEERKKLGAMLELNGMAPPAPPKSWGDIWKVSERISLIPLALETGFTTKGVSLLTEGDIFGKKRRRRITRSRADIEDVMRRFQHLMPGDLVAHLDHGIGRFVGLKRITVHGKDHECFEIIYRDEGRLLLPVENAELLSRYGRDSDEVQLDRLGAAAWQARHARTKKRVLEMARKLIDLAARRASSEAKLLAPPAGLYEEFCARFPYEETPDQKRAADELLRDFTLGKPMDRLVCGDVGFGKTELALRAAFVTAMGGAQTAILTPTTLLCRQHLETFRKRFQDLPVSIGHISRLVPPKTVAATRQAMKDGSLDIVIGTHALLSKDVQFRNLGLLIIDEEQHFGVAHKEKMKALKENVHTLTLTATPIPRTLQFALVGARDMSLIATPPPDRMSVRSFIGPFDAMTIRRALMREKARDGQSFIICPRISDIGRMERFLKRDADELSVLTLHGRMPPKQIEQGIAAFYDGRADILLSTHIVESGLDIPAANTIIVHRSHMFGLAQLHQLRGRVGRSDRQAYAYFTVPVGERAEKAEGRLSALQSVDSLGAGFSLAAQDLDMRGAGNLLGAEQSGHIREVGYELYQQMLGDAVREIRARDDGEETEKPLSPRIRLGLAALIPEEYIPDLPLRLRLYRRLADLREASEIDAFAQEMSDRFGEIPREFRNLLRIASLKILCRRAGLSSVEAGAHGGVFAFYRGRFANPEGLARFLMEEGRGARLRPDHTLAIERRWPEARRLDDLHDLLASLAKIAEDGGGENMRTEDKQ